jgi:membrane-associated phospholipid phosphatase
MARDDLDKAKRRAAAAAGKAADADAAAAQAMEPFAETPWLGHLASLGDQPQLRTLCAALIAAGAAAGRRSGFGPRLVRAGVRMLIAHQLATTTKNFIKHRVDRRRPRALEDSGKDHRPRPGDSSAKEDTSFPSGHAAGAAAAARAFAREFPELRGLAAAAGGTLSIVQVPRCAHYPTDIGAGVAIGLAAEAAAAVLWPPRTPERQTTRELERTT